MIKVKKRKILLLPGDGIGPEVINEVKKIIRSTGTTTIMVTHDEREAERLSDECYLLENGKIKSI